MGYIIIAGTLFVGGIIAFIAGAELAWICFPAGLIVLTGAIFEKH
jgi:hypothetical protein